MLSLYGEYLSILVLFIDALDLLVRITPRLPVDQCIALDHAMGCQSAVQLSSPPCLIISSIGMFLIGIAVAESQSMNVSPGERTS